MGKHKVREQKTRERLANEFPSIPEEKRGFMKELIAPSNLTAPKVSGRVEVRPNVIRITTNGPVPVLDPEPELVRG